MSLNEKIETIVLRIESYNLGYSMGKRGFCKKPHQGTDLKEFMLGYDDGYRKRMELVKYVFTILKYRYRRDRSLSLDQPNKFFQRHVEKNTMILFRKM